MAQRKTKLKAEKAVKAPKVVESFAARAAKMLREEFGDESADTLADGGYSKVHSVLPTGIEVMDRWVIGIGGLPYGRIIEISGPEDVGKSSLINQLMGAAQRDGAVACLGDAERKVQPEWVDVFGVDRKEIILLPAETVEQFLSQIRTMLRKYGKTKKLVFILDSVATCMPKKALESDLNEAEIPGAMGAAWSRGLRALHKTLSASSSMLILVNQLRSKIGVMYGPTEDTPGGRAIKHYASLRIGMGHGKSVKDGDKHVAKWANVRVLKNHLGPGANHRKATILLDFEVGWNDERSTMYHAKEMGCVTADCRSIEEARKNLGWSGVVDPAEVPAST
jgi:recombination protein RecA